MKGMKKLSILALGLVFVSGLAACSNSDNTANTGANTTPTTTNSSSTTKSEPNVIVDGDVTYVDFAELEAGIGNISDLKQPSNYPGIYVNEQNKLKYELSDISVHLAHTRQRFYLGEEFSSEGLIVLASFISLNEDGSYAKDKDNKTIVTKASVHTFFVDSSAVDTSVMGSYDVQVSYRYGETVKVTTYTISVSSSEFETTPNLEYYAGINTRFDKKALPAGTKLSTDGKILTRLVSVNQENDFELDLDTIKLSLIKNKVNGVASAFEQTVSDVDLSSFTNDTKERKAYNADKSIVIDYSDVDGGKEGSYLIRITYKAPNISINGQPRENIVEGFIIVNINNPITAISYAGDPMYLEFESSISGIDLSDWKIKLTKEVGDPVIVDFDYDMFKVTNVDDFTWNKPQTITVSLIDNNLISFNQSIIILESETQNIVKYLDLEQAATAGEDNTYALGGTDFIFGPAGATYTGNRTSDKYGSMVFPTRITIKGSGQPIKVVMDKPGQIMVFFASSGDEERELVFADSNKEEISTAISSGKKQEIVSAIFTCDEAGTYYIYNTAGGMYFHGMIVAKEK